MQCLIISSHKMFKENESEVLNKDMRTCVVVKYSLMNNNVLYMR